MVNIYHRVRLRPSQLRTVAQRRFDDAEALRRTRRNRHANGAMYLAGFVIECLLKAKLMEKYLWLRTATFPGGPGKKEQRIWSLCYRSHDLGEILWHLPEVSDRVANGGRGLLDSLRSICGQWTIFARYSTRTATMSEAAAFLDQIRELKECLR